MKDKQVRELLYQALETEIGGVQIYTTALRCAENEDLKEEWEEYLEQTKTHVTIMELVIGKPNGLAISTACRVRPCSASWAYTQPAESVVKTAARRYDLWMIPALMTWYRHA